MSDPNPFRRVPVNNNPAEADVEPVLNPGISYRTASNAPSSEATASDNAIEPPRPKAPSTTKKLRFTTPPRSPDAATDEHTSSALASHGFDLGAYYDGPLTELSNQPTREQARDKRVEFAASSGEQEGVSMATASVTSRAGTVPHNPFSRTSASMEGELGVSRASRDQAPSERSELTSSPAKASNRTTMDVNAFKNLLMTGKAPEHAPGAPPSILSRPQTLTLADNSSSTDTSSISRQSLAEPMSNETPRTSYERSDEEEDDAATTVPRRSDSKKVKPPPPKPRYGKSISRGPQIVSFDDFTSTEADNDASKIPPEAPKRPSGEYNKPLPPIPQRESRQEAAAQQEPSPPVEPEPEPRASVDSDRSEISVQKRQAPPPPLARRSSHRNPAPPPIRTKSSTSASIREDNDNLSIAESTTSSNRIAPPPPPTRRGGAATAHSAVRADEPSPSGSSRPPSIKSPPPPPASRHRASSRASAVSIPTSLNQSITSPPPPPPPRRTSSKSSIDIISPRRTSGEIIRQSFDSERRSSVASSIRRIPITEEDAVAPESPKLERVTSPSTASVTSPNDILDDMDKFQKEIDALMARDALDRRKVSGGSEGGSGEGGSKA